MKTTKTILLTLIGILTVLLFIQACEKQDRSLLASEHLLNKDETLTINKDQKEIKITLLAIQDSRCPPNVQCVWEGYGTALLKFQDDNKSQNITTCIGACELMAMRPQETLVLNGIDYKIKLIELSNQTAKIALSRL